ncbi:MAG: hypothetical protein Q9159_006366 [Coniocarpon cinnabarinum]
MSHHKQSEEDVALDGGDGTASGNGDKRVHYTAFIRLPFPRGDFEDPPLVRSEAFAFKILYLKRPRSIGMQQRIKRSGKYSPTILEAPSSIFILQQAAWLYERQLSQVREQMRRVNKPDDLANEEDSGKALAGVESPPGRRASFAQPGTSPTPQAQGITKQLKRLSTGTDVFQGSSALKPRPEAANIPLEGKHESFEGWPKSGSMTESIGTSLTKTASNETLTRGSQQAASGRVLRPRPSFQRHTPPDRKSSPILTGRRPSQLSAQRPRDLSPASHSSSESSASEEDNEKVQPKRSQFLHRPPNFGNSKGAAFRPPGGAANVFSHGNEDEEDDSPFLPFSQPLAAEEDLGATLRGEPKIMDSQTDGSSEAAPAVEPGRGNEDTSASSTTSSMAPEQYDETPTSQRSPESNTFSPHRRPGVAELKTPRTGKGRENSEGTPSMGSSFSDLDDTSVTQSALEEALLSNVQKGTTASRISNLSQALRSQYSRYQGSSNPRQA